MGSGLGRKITISIVTTVAVLGCAEIGLRWAGYARGPALYFDPEIGTRYYPDQVRTMVGPGGVDLGAVRLNGAGFRGPLYLRPPEPGVLRIACLGDSFTFGWGVGEGETYPCLLERALEARLGPGRVQVSNFGMPGHNTWNELQVYRQIVRPTRPATVVIGFFLNDVQPRDVRGLPHSESWPAQRIGKTALARFFGRHLRSRLGLFEVKRTEEEERRFRAYVDHEHLIQFEPEAELARPYWDRSMAALADLVEEVTADGAELLCVNFPTRGQVQGIRTARAGGAENADEVVARWSRPARYLAARCAELGVPCLDLLEAFVESDSDPYGALDREHPSAHGYELSAARIVPALPP